MIAGRISSAHTIGHGLSRIVHFILPQEHALDVARGSWVAVRIFVAGQIPHWIKELLCVAISVDRRRMYCAAAHITCCRGHSPSLQLTSTDCADSVGQLEIMELIGMAAFAVYASIIPDATGMDPPRCSNNSDSRAAIVTRSRLRR